VQWPWLEPVTYALALGAMALAWLLTRRHRHHRPFAVLLTFGLAVDVVRRLLYVNALAPAEARAQGGPLTGWGRIVSDVDVALFLAWPAALTATTLHVFLKRRPWPVLAAWALAVHDLAITYPTTRGEVLQRVYLWIQAATLAASWGFVIAWIRSPDRESPAFHQVCVALVLATEMTSLFVGPWKAANLFAAWPLAQLAYAGLFVFLILLQGGVLWATTR
jgi:uncharacterized protein (TIGR03382 family)